MYTESILVAAALRGKDAAHATFVEGLLKLVQVDNAKAHLAETMLNGYVKLGIASLAVRPKSPWQDGRVETLMLTFKEEFRADIPGFTATLEVRY